jgi:hypothetical protein
MRRAAEAHHILDGQALLGIDLLFHQRDTPRDIDPRHATQIRLAQGNDTACHLAQPADEAQQARLPRPIGADEAQRRPRSGMKRHPVDDHLAADTPANFFC